MKFKLASEGTKHFIFLINPVWLGLCISVWFWVCF